MATRSAKRHNPYLFFLSILVICVLAELLIVSIISSQTYNLSKFSLFVVGSVRSSTVFNAISQKAYPTSISTSSSTMLTSAPTTTTYTTSKRTTSSTSTAQTTSIFITGSITYITTSTVPTTSTYQTTTIVSTTSSVPTTTINSSQSMATFIEIPNSNGRGSEYTYIPIETTNATTIAFICQYFPVGFQNPGFLNGTYGSNFQSKYTLEGQLQISNLGQSLDVSNSTYASYDFGVTCN